MKKALHLLDGLRFGGAENVALNYARVMREWGAETTLVGKIDSDDFVGRAAEVCRIRERLSLSLLRSSEVIFIHTNRRLLQVLFYRCFFRKRRQQIVYIQHLPYSERKFRLLSKIINRVCTDFVRITPVTEKQVEKHITIRRSFIPNFYIDRYPKEAYASIRESVRQEQRLGDDAVVLLFSGVLRPGKGLDDFLALAGRMSDDTRFCFWIVGDGEGAGKIAGYSGGNVRWFGFQEDVERYLIASDGYCFLSRNEMMPMALIEAMNTRRKIAAISSPVNDFLLDGKTYAGLAETEVAIRAGRLETPRAIYGKAYAREALEALLGWNSPRKILHIQVIPKLTGVQRISLEIFRALPDEEYKKTILFSEQATGGDQPACLEAFRAAGVTVIQSPNLRREIGGWDVKAFREIYRLCRREKYDIVHTHSTKPGVVGRIAARLAGVPCVVHTVHGVAFHRHEHWLRRLLYYGCELFASLFSHRMTLVAGYYQRYYRMLRKRVRVIPNGIDYALLPAPKERVEDGVIRLLSVGRLDRPKDPLTLLRAFERMARKYGQERVRLTLVGDGELMANCRSYIAQHQLEKSVWLAGWQSNVGEFYMNHDIFCLSSIFESFGLCLLEAGYYGLPSVATRVEGVPEVIADGETGFLVPAQNPEAMARQIACLMEDSELRKTMGEAARKRVVEKFTAERMTSAYKQLYKEEAI